MRTRIAALASAALLGALAGASGCTDNRASIQVQMICQPSSTCTYTGGCETEYAGYPIFDRAVSTASALVLHLQVANQLPNNEDLSAGRLNTNNAHVDEVAVTVSGVVSGDYTVGANGGIPAGSASVVGVVIPLPALVDGEALAKIRLRGYYDDGTRFETGEFPVTILVCSSCVATPLCDVGAQVCPEGGEGQRPLTCGAAPATP